MKKQINTQIIIRHDKSWNCRGTEQQDSFLLSGESISSFSSFQDTVNLEFSDLGKRKHIGLQLCNWPFQHKLMGHKPCGNTGKHTQCVLKSCFLRSEIGKCASAWLHPLFTQIYSVLRNIVSYSHGLKFLFLKSAQQAAIKKINFVSAFPHTAEIQRGLPKKQVQLHHKARCCSYQSSQGCLQSQHQCKFQKLPQA